MIGDLDTKKSASPLNHAEQEPPQRFTADPTRSVLANRVGYKSVLSRRQMETLCRGPGLGIRFKYMEYWDAAPDAELPIWLGRFAAQQETWKAVDVNSLVPSSAKDTVSSRGREKFVQTPEERSDGRLSGNLQ
jgi:hypothetical protein